MAQGGAGLAVMLLLAALSGLASMLTVLVRVVLRSAAAPAQFKPAQLEQLACGSATRRRLARFMLVSWLFHVF